jgi:hypothetical protein
MNLTDMVISKSSPKHGKCMYEDEWGKGDGFRACGWREREGP